MNYQKAYDALCARGLARKAVGGKKLAGFEDHHVLPRCMGGDNMKGNLARLTAREHFLAHWLLCRIYPAHRGMRLAFWRMVNTQAKGMLNSRGYAELRGWFAEVKRAELIAKHQDPEYAAGRAELSRCVMASHSQRLGVLASEALDKLRADPAYQNRYRAAHRSAISHAVVGDGVVFEALVEAAQWLRGNGYANAAGNKIGMCCAGKLKRAYGQTWRYASPEETAALKEKGASWAPLSQLTV